MREIITLQIGQCGNQFGGKFWEELYSEHAFSNSTTTTQSCIDHCSMVHENTISSSSLPIQYSKVFLDEVVSKGMQQEFIPRVIMGDLDSTCLDAMFSSSSSYSPTGKHMFREEFAFGGHVGSGCNYARGFYTNGGELKELLMDGVRRQVERCESLEGFQMFHSIGGGTGSGLGSLLIRSIREEFPNKIMSAVTILPTERSFNNVLEPYNSVLGAKSLINDCDSVICLDNEALVNVCNRNGDPMSFDNFNKLISKFLAGMTSPFRFSGLQNTGLRKMIQNLIPFPRLHFFIGSTTSLNRTERMETVNDILMAMFSHSNLLSSVKPNYYMTAATIFRGDVQTVDQDLKDFVFENRFRIPFKEWIANNIHSSLCKVPPVGISKSGTLVCNSSSISQVLSQSNDAFRKLFKKKAFIQWYTSEGMDEGEFVDAETDLGDIISEYTCTDGCFWDEEDEEEHVPQPDQLSN